MKLTQTLLGTPAMWLNPLKQDFSSKNPDFLSIRGCFWKRVFLFLPTNQTTNQRAQVGRRPHMPSRLLMPHSRVGHRICLRGPRRRALGARILRRSLADRWRQVRNDLRNTWQKGALVMRCSWELQGQLQSFGCHGLVGSLIYSRSFKSETFKDWALVWFDREHTTRQAGL